VQSASSLRTTSKANAELVRMAEQPLTYCVKPFQVMEKKRNLFKVVVRDRNSDEERICFIRSDSSWAAVVECLGSVDRESALVSVSDASYLTETEPD